MNLFAVIEFVVKAHNGQVRKHSGVPYVMHVFSVMNFLLECGITDPNIFAICLCHDILEDCPHISYEELESVIGVENAKVVLELTFDSSKISKSEYLESFKDKSLQALIVKIADRICNTKDFYNSDSKYAPVYWKKATALLSVFSSKMTDFQATFGLTVTANIKYNIDLIRQMAVA